MLLNHLPPAKGGRCTLLIVREILCGSCGFNDFPACPGVRRVQKSIP